MIPSMDVCSMTRPTEMHDFSSQINESRVESQAPFNVQPCSLDLATAEIDSVVFNSR